MSSTPPPANKPLAWLTRQGIETPPWSSAARIEVGYLLRQLQQGETLEMPQSRPMGSIDSAAHELRINDETSTWRVIYAIEDDAIVLLVVFSKKTNKTPQSVIDTAKRRLREYREI